MGALDARPEEKRREGADQLQWRIGVFRYNFFFRGRNGLEMKQKSEGVGKRGERRESEGERKNVLRIGNTFLFTKQITKRKMKGF